MNPVRVARRYACGLALFLWSCGTSADRATLPSGQPRNVRANHCLERVTVSGYIPPGVSGIDADGRGEILAVTERNSELLHISLKGNRATVQSVISLSGLKSDQDAEALARLDRERVAVGTERHGNSREYDDIFVYQLEGSKAIQIDRLRLPYAMWNIFADDNRGIEGACYAKGALLVGIETPISEGETRYAPIARYSFDTKQWMAFRLRLTSKEGVLSSLACRPSAAGGQIEVVAIERFYQTSRILKFYISSAGPGRDLNPVLEKDLAHLIRGHMPNWEGIAFSNADSYVLMSDNQSASLSGPTELTRIHKSPVNCP